MNLIAPVAKPIFRANHDWVMRNGGEGLAKLLERGCCSTTRARLARLNNGSSKGSSKPRRLRARYKTAGFAA